ncbi:MAG: hypothetical protein ACKOPU_02620 [Candidatus Planktophila sp.]
MQLDFDGTPLHFYFDSAEFVGPPTWEEWADDQMAAAMQGEQP